MTDEADQCFFCNEGAVVGLQEASRIDLSRRQLLGGVAGGSAVLYAAGANAEPPLWYDLRFRLSDDLQTLLVVETSGLVPSQDRPTPPRKVAGQWRIPAIAFGPKAWFDMSRPEGKITPVDAEPRLVVVRDAAYGGRRDVEVRFRFTRPKTGPQPGRWHVVYETNLWLTSGGAPKFEASEPPVALGAFLTGAKLVEIFAPGRVGRTIERVFDGQLRVSDPPPKNFSVTLDQHLTWSTKAIDGGGLSAFSGQATVPELFLAWYRNPDDKEFFFAGQGKVAAGAQAPERLVIGDGVKHHVEVRLRPPVAETSGLALEARIGVAPVDPSLSQTVVALRVGAGDLIVKNGPKVLSGPVRADALVMSRTRLPKDKDRVRTVLWGRSLGGEASDPEEADPDGRGHREIATPVGRLRIGPPALEQIAERSREEVGAGRPADADAAAQRSGAGARFFQAASGDKGGQRDASVYVVHDAATGTGAATAGLRRLAVELSLHEASPGLPDASYSRLTFKRADLRLVFDDGKLLGGLPAGEYPRLPASSFVWVGPAAEDATVAALDLSRATLTCARDYDLMKLRLRFQDLQLAFAFASEPAIRAVPAACRVIEQDGGEIADGRPILIADLDPQHVLEEAVFRPEPPPLPDVPLTRWPDAAPTGQAIPNDAILKHLNGLGTVTERAEFRLKVRAIKAENQAFGDFARRFEAGAGQLGGLPADQLHYIGPFALDPDASALARQLQKTESDDAILSYLNAMLARVASRIDGNLKGSLLPVRDPPGRPGPPTDPNIFFVNAVRNEALLERQETLYGVFRDLWRDRLVRARNLGRRATPSQVKERFGFEAPGDERVDEYLIEGNRPDGLAYPPEIRDRILKDFVRLALGREELDDLMGARLSDGSRLAFRVNCQPVAGLDAEEAGLPGSPPHGPARPGTGAVSYAPIPFTFEALTDWSRHEPAVIPRARKLFRPLVSGLLPPLGNRGADEGDHEILRQQGLSTAPTTAAQRLSEIRASLARTPNAFETAIEIPSRLILSTAQDAVWRTKRRLPPAIANRVRSSRFEPAPTIKSGVDVTEPGAPVSIRGHSLWSARLGVADAKPSLRVVASPDLRPTALGGYEAGDPVRLPGHGAPPRGPYAPWFIGPEQSESGVLTPDQVKEAQRRRNAPDRSYRLLRWLADRIAKRAAIPSEGYEIFRTSLDANDRHQLVLLSSAYGLPVTGKRQQVDDAEVGGGLVSESGQIEPGEAFSLLDARDDQAIYRPIPLNVRELALSALGGSFVHDTAFKPAAGATDLFGRKIFDGFSIERWQHEVVLGRDVRAKVVYKGYLFPFGHRASMIKLTERVFLRTPSQGIKALLRQRLYLEVANPDKAYPAVGQPHSGRLWCGKSVRLTVARTPDILDPSPNVEGGAESLAGRIGLDPHPGLAFWPRTDITEEGRFKFDLSVDGATSSLPLIFVDNIAATNQGSLGVIAAYYRDKAPAKVRTLTFGGQKVCFAPEKVTGDASFKTQSVEVRAHGRYREDDASWTGQLDDFQTTGVLEGAEQPPFYPALRSATIRVDQIERFSGGQERPVTVQYDGHYVRYGFAEAKAEPPPGAEKPPYTNPLDVFLNLRTVTPIEMGANGDRSAGIGRPEASVIALSRQKGPLGGDGKIWWHKNASDAAPVDKDVKESFADLLKEAEGLLSLAAYFNSEKEKPASVGAVSGPAPTVTRAQTIPKPDDYDNLIKKLRVVMSYFKPEAKLLGTITLKQLMTLLDIKTDQLPLLKEAIEYGTAIQSQAGEVAGDLSRDVRSRVLTPLRAVIGRLRSEWKAIDAALKARQEALVGAASPLTLAEVYPEIDEGLARVERSLDQAIATEDPLSLAPALAVVYEDARQLIHVLAVIAANPVERLQEAVGADVQRRLETLRGEFGQLVAAVASLRTLFDQLRALTPAVIAAAIVDLLDPPGAAPAPGVVRAAPRLVEQLSLMVPPPDLAAVALSVLGTLSDAVKAQIGVIATKLASDLAGNVRTALRNLLRDLIAEVLRGGNATDRIQAVVASAVKSLVDGMVGRLEDAVKDAKQAVGIVFGGAQNAVVLALLQAQLDAFEAEVRSRLKKAVDDGIDIANERYPAELAFAIRSAHRIAASVERLRRAESAVRSGKPQIMLREASDLAQDLWGIAPEAAVETALTALIADVKAGAERLKVDFEPFFAVTPGKLRDEVAACRSYRGGTLGAVPLAEPSEPLKPLANAINQLTALKAQVQAILALVVANSGAMRPPVTVAAAQTFSQNALRLLEDGRSGLIPEAKELYCSTVDLMVAVRTVQAQLAALTTPAGRPRFDRGDIETLADAARTLRRTIDDLGRRIGSIVKQVVDFLSNGANRPFLAAGVLFGGVAATVRVTDIEPSVKAAFLSLENAANTSEKSVAEALSGAVEGARLALRAGATASAAAVTAVREGVKSVISGVGKSGASLEPEGAAFVKALDALVADLAAIAALKSAGTQVTIAELMDKVVVDPTTTVGSFFGAGRDASPYRALAAALRDRETILLATWRTFQQRVEGLPAEIAGAVEAKLASSGAFAALAGGYAEVLKARNDALRALDAMPIMKAAARRALLVPPLAGACPLDDPKKTVAELWVCDRLAEEAKAVAEARDGLTPATRAGLVVVLRSWSAGQAALLVIIANSVEIANSILRGDILAVIDLGAFRDQIEDAIAALIPTRATLNYDFRSSVRDDPGDKAIFQPAKGAAFGIEVRAKIDLLATKDVEFTARGYLGPFDIKLVGGLVDALTLKFGGATFEMRGGAKPRFDVAYQDFVIGKDLEFAQQLQSYLVPEEGGGVFVQPLLGKPGIEAGYGINLGVISLGATSFFNVTLNVSAELPFDNRESLFKVSLGRRLAPFTMSVLPFAGSGYFSIFASADGIRGFEASFEFGGGGSLRFGPLTAQARIQVGVFVQVMKVDDDTVTTIFGTFFAGGSASIWIFHFATSLSVRLGTADDGAMYGEATFSFSFSLGIVDYDYSVTANRREEGIGKKKKADGNTWLLDGAPGGRSPIRYAQAMLPGTLSDALPPGAVRLVDGWDDDQPVRSLAVGLGEDCLAFLDYFDHSLLPSSELA